MTISSTATRAEYLGNAVTTAFSAPFAYLSTGEVKVYLDGVLQSTGYTVSAAPASSGTVTFSSAPGTGVKVVVTRATAKTQNIDYVANDAFAADVTEGGFDRAMLAAQDNAAAIGRSLRVADYLPAIDPIADPDAVVLAWADSITSVTGAAQNGAVTVGGADATGTDDSAAFSAAIAAVVSKGGGVVSIPSGGNYRIASNINLGNGSDGVFSTQPGFGIAGLSPVGGFGANNPVGGGALILDGAQIKAPGPQSGGSLRDLFIITPGDYPAGQWAVDLYEVSYGRFDNLNFSLYAGNGMRFTGYGDNGNLFNAVGTLRFRLDTGVAAAGSKALELTQTGTIVDTASSTFDFVGVLPGRADQVAVTLGNCDTNSFGYLEVYPIPTPASTAVGATTNAAGYAAGVSTVTLASAGTGMLVTGDCFQFANHTTTYRLTSGDADVSNGGSISFTPALTNSLPASAQAITVVTSAVALRLDYTADADYPQSNTIDHFDCFNNRIESIGTPTQLAKNNPNVINYLNQQGVTPIPTDVSGLVVNRKRLKEGVLYVNAGTGHDTLAAGLAPEGALKTIQKAYDLAALYYDLEGDLTIKLADGTYTAGLVAAVAAIGKKVTIQGNPASPGSVVLNVSGTDAIVADGCRIVVRDVLLTGASNGLRAINGGRIEYTNIVFDSIVGAHLYADGGFIEQTGACFIVQGAAQHISVRNGRYTSASATTLLANVTVTNFVKCSMGGYLRAVGATYPVGAYAVTGQRYLAEYSASIDTNGGGASFFPGSTSGASTGANYI